MPGEEDLSSHFQDAGDIQDGHNRSLTPKTFRQVRLLVVARVAKHIELRNPRGKPFALHALCGKLTLEPIGGEQQAL